MSYLITVLPSARQFEAQANEPLLEAALRAGLNLTYQCNSGSCGECKVKVLAGEYARIRHADYPLSDLEKSSNMVLMCSVAAASNMSIEAAEAKKGSDIAEQRLTIKSAKLQQNADHYWELQVRTPRSQTLRFLAGQAVRFVDNGKQSREIAIASCPCNGMNLQFHLSDDEKDDIIQRIIHGKLKQWDIVGPYGNFTFDDDSRRSSVFIAFDTGFAPIKSLVEHALALEKEQSMYLFWIMPKNRAHYQANYCRAWEDAFDGFVYMPMSIDHADVEFENLARRIIARCPSEADIDLYLAGPVLMKKQMRSLFIRRGTPEQRIFCA